MLLSSGVIWRHRELEAFRRGCPRGDLELQTLVWERLDDALDWLESLGASVLARDTGNPLTVGRRFETHALTDTLHPRRGGRLGEPLREQEGEIVLATGGFGVAAQDAGWRFAQLRGRTAAGSPSPGLRRRPPAGRDAQFYGRHARAPRSSGRPTPSPGRGSWPLEAEVVDDDGAPVFEERRPGTNDLAQSLAHVPSAWYRIADSELDRRVRGRDRRHGEDRRGARRGRAPHRRRHGRAGRGRRHAHTIGGLRIDTQARVLDASGAPVHGPPRGGRGRGRHLHGQVRQRPGGRARARPRRRGGCLNGNQVGAAPAVAGGKEGARACSR